MFISLASKRISRRQVLRGAGVTMALPLLEAMVPAFSRAASSGDPAQGTPRRMIGICNNLGVLPAGFFPDGGEAGADYKLSPYLSEIAAHRSDFTVFSGVSHPGVDGSHSSDVSFLTAAPHPGGGGFRNTISLDQLMARELGHLTRFPSLTLGVNVKQERRSLSWSASGVLIPCENRASNVYRQLFLQGSKAEVDRQVRRLQLGESIMDSIADQSRSLHRRLGSGDRERIDQYTTAVRELEQRMVKSREWERIPKPQAPTGIPEDPSEASDYMEKTRLMYQMARLAFETDSTRCVSLLLDSNNSPTIEVEGAEISDGYHNLSHHGKNKKKLAQLDAIDRCHMQQLGELIEDLRSVDEGESSLLDRTSVLYGSNFGDANKHTTNNMPVLLAGGGFKHGHHLAFDREKNYPLPNLFLSLLQRMGIGAERFATSSGTMRGLEFS
ncbi:MAG: DUF1552 domain-containing protein [Verrucomicrobiales bacterium]